MGLNLSLLVDFNLIQLNGTGSFCKPAKHGSFAIYAVPKVPVPYIHIATRQCRHTYYFYFVLDHKSVTLFSTAAAIC